MANARASFFVGLVIVAGVFAFIAMYSVTNRGFRAQEGTYTVYALFEDVSGLSRGTRVTVAGVPVGEVLTVGIDPESPDRARVEMGLLDSVELFSGERDDQGRVVLGATVTRRSASLLGDQYLELTRGVKGPRLRNGEQIPTAISVSGLGAVMKQFETTGNMFQRLDTIFTKLDTIATDVSAVTSSVRGIFAGPEGEKRLNEVATNVTRVSSDLTGVVGDVKEIVKDVRGFTKDFKTFADASILGRGDQIGRIVGNVERFSANAAKLSASATRSTDAILADVKAVTGDIRALISGNKGNVESSIGTLQGTMRSFTHTLNKLNSGLDAVASIAGKIDGGQGTIGRLINDDQILKNVEEVIADAGDLVKSVTQIQTRVELTSEFYFGQRSLKNYLRLRLQPKEDKYYLIELIDDPRGKTVHAQRVVQTNDPSLPPVVHETTSTTESGLKFSFQFAKKWYFLTGRFGIIEGTGGLGLDMEFFDDTFKFTTDLFDFQQDEAPRMRILANYTFYRHFTVSAGVDDIFNEAGFDWFLGLGIRFTDDDLKGITTVAPLPSL